MTDGDHFWHGSLSAIHFASEAASGSVVEDGLI